MKQAQGKEVFMRLAAKTDIIVENFRPGVTKKLGIDYEAIRKINPGVIYALKKVGVNNRVFGGVNIKLHVADNLPAKVNQHMHVTARLALFR